MAITSRNRSSLLLLGLLATGKVLGQSIFDDPYNPYEDDAYDIEYYTRLPRDLGSGDNSGEYPGSGSFAYDPNENVTYKTPLNSGDVGKSSESESESVSEEQCTYNEENGIKECPCHRVKTLKAPESDACSCKCEPKEVVTPIDIKKESPLQVVFLVDTSDSMQNQAHSSNHKNINYWIYSMVKKLQHSFSDENFIVLVQFADKFLVDFANSLTTQALDRDFEKVLLDLQQQETSTNGYGALSKLVKLMNKSISMTDDLRRVFERASRIKKWPGLPFLELLSLKKPPPPVQPSHSQYVNRDLWEERSNSTNKKLLFIITDGQLRDGHQQYDAQHAPDGLIKDVGKTFDRTDILIINEELDNVDPGLQELAQYGYLEEWTDTNSIIEGINEMSNAVQRTVQKKDFTQEVVVVMEKSFCQCEAYDDAKFRYRHIKQFIKKVSNQFFRTNKYIKIKFTIMEYFSKQKTSNKKDNICNLAYSGDKFGPEYIDQCCNNEQHSAEGVSTYHNFKSYLRDEYKFFSEKSKSYTCRRIDMDFALQQGSNLFRGRFQLRVAKS